MLRGTETVGAGDGSVHVIKNRSSRNVVERRKPARHLGKVFCKAKSYPRAAIVANYGGPLRPQVNHQLTDVPRHGLLVVSTGRLLRRAIAPEIRNDHSELFRQCRNLVSPRIPTLREPVEKYDSRP